MESKEDRRNRKFANLMLTTQGRVRVKEVFVGFVAFLVATGAIFINGKDLLLSALSMILMYTSFRWIVSFGVAPVVRQAAFAYGAGIERGILNAAERLEHLTVEERAAFATTFLLTVVSTEFNHAPIILEGREQAIKIAADFDPQLVLNSPIYKRLVSLIHLVENFKDLNDEEPFLRV